MRLKGLVERGGKWILRRRPRSWTCRRKEKARRVAEQDKASKLLKSFAAGDDRSRKFAQEAFAGIDDKYKFEPLAWALRSKNADVRLFAEKELGRVGDRRSLRPLLWRAVHDPTPTCAPVPSTRPRTSATRTSWRRWSVR